MAVEDTGSKMEAEVTCVCPFCDAEVDASAPWCDVCEVELRFCVVCEEPLPQDASECPSCGAACEE